MSYSLGVEKGHANDMHDLLIAYEGKPMLRKLVSARR
jgi:hypothetical protein